MKRIVSILLTAVLLLFSCALGEETETSFLSFEAAPSVAIVAPGSGQTYDAGGILRVQAEGRNVKRIQLTFTCGDLTLTVEEEGSSISHTFDTYQFTVGIEHRTS